MWRASKESFVCFPLNLSSAFSLSPGPSVSSASSPCRTGNCCGPHCYLLNSQGPKKYHPLWDCTPPIMASLSATQLSSHPTPHLLPEHVDSNLIPQPLSLWGHPDITNSSWLQSLHHLPNGGDPSHVPLAKMKLGCETLLILCHCPAHCPPGKGSGCVLTCHWAGAPQLVVSPRAEAQAGRLGWLQRGLPHTVWGSPHLGRAQEDRGMRLTPQEVRKRRSRARL